MEKVVINKVLIINKCQDCKYHNCKLRQLAGLIPKECPLVNYQDLPNVNWDNLLKTDISNNETLGA